MNPPTRIVADISQQGKQLPRIPHRTRLAYRADYARPPVRCFLDWGLDAWIDRTRDIAEGHAIGLFALRLVPTTRGHVYRQMRRAHQHQTAFSQAQARLRRLWAERCRRDGVEYDARVSRGDDR